MKIFTKILACCFIAIVGVVVLGWAGPVQAVGETEVVFENGNDKPLFDEANFLPGQSVSRWVNFKNNTTDTLTAATKAINPSNPDNFGDWFDLVITEGGIERYSGTLTEYFNAGEIMLSDVAGGGTQTQYDFIITMDASAGNDMQGKTLQFDIQVGVGSEETIGDETDSGGGGSGGGGSAYRGLYITNEAIADIHDTFATITWLTNYEATSRVVYDTSSHPNIAGTLPPNYGYQFSNDEDSSLATGHSMTITGLISGTTYYFRPVSHGSPEVYGKELAFTTTKGEYIPTETTPPTGVTAPVAEPTPTPIASIPALLRSIFAPSVPTEEVVAGEATATEPILPAEINPEEGKVAGAATCPSCSIWLWLFIIIIHLLACLVFHSYCQKNYKESLAAPADNAALIPKQPASLSGWLLPVAIIYLIEFILLWLVCALVWYYPLIILGLTFLALTGYARLFLKIQDEFAKIGLIITLTLLPVMTFVFYQAWPVWVFITVLILYILAVGGLYLYLAAKRTNSRLYWLYSLLGLAWLGLALLWLLRDYSCLI